MDITGLIFVVSVMEASVNRTISQLRRELVPIFVVNESLNQPSLHAVLDSLINVASHMLLHELLLAVDEHTCEDTCKEMGAVALFAHAIDLVDMLRTAAFEEFDK